jgi:glyoxalase/bleomycin resistance protein/dioxygenase superfamily protein
MGKLRHIAIQVPDLEKAAAFYEGVFGLKRLKKVEAPIGNAISLSDGVLREPRAARVARTGRDCITSVSLSKTRLLPSGRLRSAAASFLCNCQIILVSTLKRNSKTLMALCSTCLSTAGASPKVGARLTSLLRTSRTGTISFIAALLLVLVLCTYVPFISLGLVHFFYGA